MKSERPSVDIRSRFSYELLGPFWRLINEYSRPLAGFYHYRVFLSSHAKYMCSPITHYKCYFCYRVLFASTAHSSCLAPGCYCKNPFAGFLCALVTCAPPLLLRTSTFPFHSTAHCALFLVCRTFLTSYDVLKGVS